MSSCGRDVAANADAIHTLWPALPVRREAP